MTADLRQPDAPCAPHQRCGRGGEEPVEPEALIEGWRNRERERSRRAGPASILAVGLNPKHVGAWRKVRVSSLSPGACVNPVRIEAVEPISEMRSEGRREIGDRVVDRDA